MYIMYTCIYNVYLDMSHIIYIYIYIYIYILYIYIYIYIIWQVLQKQKLKNLNISPDGLW